MDWTGVHTAATLYFTVGAVIAFVGGKAFEKERGRVRPSAIAYCVFFWLLIGISVIIGMLRNRRK